VGFVLVLVQNKFPIENQLCVLKGVYSVLTFFGEKGSNSVENPFILVSKQ